MKTSGKTLYIALAAALALSLAFTACSDGGGGGSGKKTVVNVSITPPDKTEYVLGEDSQLDLAGLTVTVTFSDGSSLTLHGEDLAVTGFDPGAEGEQTVTVSYDKNGIAFERTFTVRVTSGESAPTYSVSASPLASFGALQTPYEPPAAQTV
ncbi:MAG: bacterial Ig-like domain-containing protein, partial [Treponema sp.]|nr:bacterial Ig-like domain-containing protein [Treponema sp.]